MPRSGYLALQGVNPNKKGLLASKTSGYVTDL